MSNILRVIKILNNKFGWTFTKALMSNLKNNRVEVAGGFLRDIIAGDEPKGDLDIFYNSDIDIKNIERLARKLNLSISYVQFNNYDEDQVDRVEIEKTDIQFIKIDGSISDHIRNFDFTCNCISLDCNGLKENTVGAIENCKRKILVEHGKRENYRYDKFIAMGWKK